MGGGYTADYDRGMCGRYTLRRIDAARLGVAYPQPKFEEFTDRRRFNVAPSQQVPIVRADAGGERVLALAAWGFVPAWAKGPPKVRPINARSETAATNGVFRTALAKRRCLIPADGFYEWRKDTVAEARAADRAREGGTPRGRPAGAAAKTPYYIRLASGEPFAFAGIWDRWAEQAGDDPADTCAILTGAANDLMRPLHDREPLVVPESAYARWLDPEASAADVADLLVPWGPDGWEAYPVSTRVNSPRNDGPDLMSPAAREG
jgi:putative SOS response-associated peptidase YedK